MCTDKYITFSCSHVVREKSFCAAFRAWKKKSRNANFEGCRAYRRVDETSDRKCMRAGAEYCVKPGMKFDAQGAKVGDGKENKEEGDLIDFGDSMAVDEKAEVKNDGGALGSLKDEMAVNKPEQAVDSVGQTANILQNALLKVVKDKKVEGDSDDPQAYLKKSRWA
ncbi:uncharacterized protein PAC_12847 [Phialocephala subalpina]|uniref:Uncharacterized protein n=1 Tax=Phialocephala subalpina TaxID=576137 RepID=A0A1L7XD30_9HELO|nr:uncharacterized protein PAC_12847 [Phialocephala subalpina]